MRLVDLKTMKAFVKEYNGVMLNDTVAKDLIRRIELYVINKSKKQEPPKPPYLIPKMSRDMSQLIREWLSDRVRGKNRVQGFPCVGGWIGRRLNKTAEIDAEADNHKSYLFLREEMWHHKTAAMDPAMEAEMMAALAISENNRPIESYPLTDFRQGKARDVKTRFNKRVRITQNDLYRCDNPFQPLHMPDDEGCYSILLEEVHAMKSFFRGNHGLQGDAGEISFWWSENERAWVLWTDWVRWVIIFDEKGIK